MPAKGHRISLSKRFADKYQICEETGCWNWTGATAEGRYGVLWFADGKSKYAHRVAYEFHIGPIPVGLSVCHRCDNGLCVNPAHLFVGTAKDNYDDMARKGRARRLFGEKNRSAKLKASQVVQIRALKSSGRSQEYVAKKFGVTRASIRAIWHGRTWTQIAPTEWKNKISDYIGGTLSLPA